MRNYYMVKMVYWDGSVYGLRIDKFYISEVEIGHYNGDGFSQDTYYRKPWKSTRRCRITYRSCLLSYVEICREKYFCPTLSFAFLFHAARSDATLRQVPMQNILVIK